MRINQCFPSWCTRASSATCPTTPRTPTPNCLPSRLVSSSRGRHCGVVPSARRHLHVIPTQTGRKVVLPTAAKLDCRKSCQNSAGKAFRSSIVLVQKASIPAPTFWRPKLVRIVACKWEKRRPPPPGAESALKELMISKVACEWNPPPGSHLGPLPFCGYEELAATATAAASDTRV